MNNGNEHFRVGFIIVVEGEGERDGHWSLTVDEATCPPESHKYLEGLDSKSVGDKLGFGPRSD